MCVRERVRDSAFQRNKPQKDERDNEGELVRAMGQMRIMGQPEGTATGSLGWGGTVQVQAALTKRQA